MGSGKTTFVERFKENSLGYLIYDLDYMVAEGLGISQKKLGDWIRENGIQSFRQLEIATLKNLLRQKTMKVIALGGGTLEDPGFWEFRDQFKLVFLNTTFATCLSRVKNDSNRPFTALGEGEMKELHKKRLYNYQKADLTLEESEIKEIEGLDSLVHTLT